MSGNPFRRAQPSRPADGTPSRDDAPATSKPRKKKVTIQTPPHSPEDVPRRLSAARVSPPPPSHGLDDDDSDTTTTADSDLEQAYNNTRRNSGSLPPPQAAEVSTTGAPSNPFARTLATSEASFGLHRTVEGQTEVERQNGENQSQTRAARPIMDVDQFKNILMTGSAAPSPPVSTPSQRLPESSSSTDTSSISRHSLFDPTLEIHPESPRTSFDDQLDSASDDNNGDEGSTLMTGTSRLDDLAPPAPPKHTHGKPLGSRGPQTVSFADFDGSSSTASPRSRIDNVPEDTDHSGKKRPPALLKSASDLNKPLPKTPPLSPALLPPTASSIAEMEQSSMLQETPSGISTEPSPPPKKNSAPPPPVARRAGQGGTGQGRARSSSNRTEDSIREDTIGTEFAQTNALSKPAIPPPPPSRKTKPVSEPATSAIEATHDAPTPAPSTTESKAMPPPPPRRTPSKTGSALVRTPSSASRSSTSRSDAHVSVANNAPPAPPPRRGNKSNRDSIDAPSSSIGYALSNRRSSGNSFESERSTTFSNLQHVQETAEVPAEIASPTGDASSSDILADMTAFQAEIDALRAQGKRPG